MSWWAGTKNACNAYLKLIKIHNCHCNILWHIKRDARCYLPLQRSSNAYTFFEFFRENYSKHFASVATSEKRHSKIIIIWNAPTTQGCALWVGGKGWADCLTFATLYIHSFATPLILLLGSLQPSFHSCCNNVSCADLAFGEVFFFFKKYFTFTFLFLLFYKMKLWQVGNYVKVQKFRQRVDALLPLCTSYSLPFRPCHGIAS